MALLKLVDDISGINFYDYRDIPYYNKFSYRARVHLLGANHLRGKDKLYDSLIKTLNKKFKKNKINENALSKFIDFKSSLNESNDVAFRFEGNIVSVFSNDLNKLHELKMLGAEKIDFTKAIISPFSGTKYFAKEPKHKYRVYFRSQIVEETTFDHLRDILTKNKDIYPSASLIDWLTVDNMYKYLPYAYRRYCRSNFSIDYDNESTYSYLALVIGNFLGNRYKLEKRPNIT